MYAADAAAVRVAPIYAAGLLAVNAAMSPRAPGVRR